MFRYSKIAAVALALTTATTAAYAANGSENDALAINKTQVSL